MLIVQSVSGFAFDLPEHDYAVDDYAVAWADAFNQISGEDYANGFGQLTTLEAFRVLLELDYSLGGLF